MATFKDIDGEEWELRLTAPLAMRIREEVDPEFLKNDFAQEDGGTYVRLANDPLMLCRVVEACCDQQRKDRSMTEEAFWRAVLGDSLDAALVAFRRALESFIPRRQRALLEAAAKQDQLQQEAIQRAIAKVDDPDLRANQLAQFERLLDLDLARMTTPSDSATITPVSSGSAQQD